MLTKYAQFPPFRSDLYNHFGYLSFNCTLINLDIIGIRLILSGEVVVITYRGARKVGFIYEGEKLTPAQAFRTFYDVPENYNDLEEYEKVFADSIEVLAPAPDNYVFLSEKEAQRK